MKVPTLAIALFAALLASTFAATPEAPKLEKGTVHFRPVNDQRDVPERYRLAEHRFAWELEPKSELATVGVRVFHLCFPSPVETACPQNNTVHAEYYRPAGKGPFPGVIVLDITAGDQAVSRSIATHLASHDIGALFVQMAYYGPRRPPGSDLRLLSHDYRQTFANIRQTVLDVRCASAWLAKRPEIDPHKLGIHGTSLGSFIGTVTAEMEPRLGKVGVLLGGGGLVEAYYDEARAAPFRKLWEGCGGTKDQLKEVIAPVDPLTCAANLKDRKVLIIAGKRDDIVPPKAAEALWEATGKQKIVWYDCTHYGAALYVVPALGELVKHFRSE
jgi:dienelactone hydrolase